MAVLRTLTSFPDCIRKGLCLCYERAYTGGEHMHEEVWFTKYYYCQNDSNEKISWIVKNEVMLVLS